MWVQELLRGRGMKVSYHLGTRYESDCGICRIILDKSLNREWPRTCWRHEEIMAGRREADDHLIHGRQA